MKVIGIALISVKPQSIQNFCRQLMLLYSFAKAKQILFKVSIKIQRLIQNISNSFYNIILFNNLRFHYNAVVYYKKLYFDDHTLVLAVIDAFLFTRYSTTLSCPSLAAQ